jgi:hypothetical protein
MMTILIETLWLHYRANEASPLHVFMETNVDCMLASVATAINGINLLEGLPTTKAVRCMLEAERLHNIYDKCSAQMLQRKTSVSNIYCKSPPPHVLCMNFSAFSKKLLRNVRCSL